VNAENIQMLPSGLTTAPSISLAILRLETRAYCMLRRLYSHCESGETQERRGLQHTGNQRT
jgi:hypothetical protein